MGQDCLLEASMGSRGIGIGGGTPWVVRETPRGGQQEGREDSHTPGDPKGSSDLSGDPPIINLSGESQIL